ncbi:MAG: hypothetical protein D6770_01810 [Anaerolineae bacterium]|nr:MAG: hypothetical protein D6770_01810 [Anaerolineae bacterium]
MVAQRALLTSLISLALLLACQVTLPIEPAPASGEILFQDDFSNRDSGWPRLAAPVGIMDYDRGGYRMLVSEPHYNLWATPTGQEFRDSRIEVNTLRLAGPRENRFGLICRYRDEQNFYFFVISSDGYYGLGKMSQGRAALLGQEQMRYNEVIRQKDAPNHLRADCVMDTLVFYVNDAPLAMAQDGEFSEGGVGLIVGAFDEAGVDILFDDFMVLNP